MKRLLLLLNFFFVSVYGWTQTTTLSFSAGFAPMGYLSGCGSGSICFVGTEFHSFNNIPMRGTHGCIGSYPSNGLIFLARNQNNGTWRRGDGLLLKFDFIRGFTYKISAKTIHKDDLRTDTRPYENNPSMQVRATNNPQNGLQCTISAEPIDIYTTIEPYADFVANSPVPRQFSNNSFTFTAQQCYSYLWLSSKPNSNESAGIVELHELKIEQTISPLSITATAICGSATTTQVTLNGVPPGVAVSWQSSNTNVATISPSGNPATLTKKGPNGATTVTATIVVCNLQRQASREVAVGIPTPILSTSLQCPEVVAFANNNVGAATYNWSLETDGGNQTRTGTSAVETFKQIYGNAYLCLTASNQCGTSYPSCRSFQCAGGGHRFTAFPNPATNTVTIELDINTVSKSLTSAAGEITSIKIYDQIGKLKRQWKFRGSRKVQLDVSNLHQGIYFVEVVDDRNFSQRQKLIVVGQ